MTDLSHKRYHRPEGFAAAAQIGNEHIHNHGDLLPLENFVTFILPKNRDTGTPEPSRRWLAVGSPMAFNPGDEALVDLENGFSQLAVIKARTGRVLEFESPLDVSPMLGGEVYKILGRQSVQIDTRFDLDTTKGRDQWEYQKRTQEEAKMLIKEGLVRDGLKDSKKPGEW